MVGTALEKVIGKISRNLWWIPGYKYSDNRNVRTSWDDVRVGDAMVWLRLDFGPGSLMGANASKSLNVWEIFKVWGGQIHAVEAFMKVMPQNNPSGWDARK